MKRPLILACSLLLPAIASAQGSNYKNDFRLINFNEDREACLVSGAQLFEEHDEPVFGTLEAQSTYTATAISLDQDWVEVEIGDTIYLVRSDDLSFGAC